MERIDRTLEGERQDASERIPLLFSLLDCGGVFPIEIDKLSVLNGERYDERHSAVPVTGAHAWSPNATSK